MSKLEKKIVDWLHNSYEHCEDVFTEAQDLVVDLELPLNPQQEIKLINEVSNLMEDWISNKENIRLDLEINYHKNPKLYDEKVSEFIRKYITNFHTN